MDAITSHVPDYDNCGHDSCSLPRRRPFERMTKRLFKNNRRQLPRQIHSTPARGDPPSAPQLEKRTGMDLSSCFCLFFNIWRLSSHTQKRSWELRFHWPKGRQINQCCLWSVKIQELFSFFSRPLKKVQSGVPSIFSTQPIGRKPFNAQV